MKTLNNETFNELKKLINNIDSQRHKSVNDYDLDLVTESEFRILDIVRELVTTEETKPTFPTVVLKLAIYDYDENDEPIRMSDEDTETCVNYITSVDGVNGYSITSYDVIEDTLD